MLKGFFSFAPGDRREATELKNGLSQQFSIRGYQVIFWDEELIDIGRDHEEAVLESIDKSQFSILMLSPDFLSNSYLMEQQLAWLFDKKKRDSQFLLLPVLLKPSPISYTKLQGIRYYAPRGEQFNIPDKEVSYSLMLRQGSPEKDEYHLDLAKRLLDSLKGVLEKEKTIFEEQISQGHPQESLIDLLLSKKKAIVSHIQKYIPLFFAEVEDDLTLRLEAKWLVEMLIARIATQEESSYDKYLSEKKYLPPEAYPQMLSQILSIIPSSVEHRKVLVQTVDEFNIKLEALGQAIE